ncbi:2-hydroxyhepta-2-4-diene-1-7-dioate isomerase [Apiospora kogelbergensis]|uniref:2-hydroxyhepta-2-4-diene-1-7-dioate isomerase n=1 Tax=Apiospora kogelbergensis TaxID=1337665 RepID=UPI0031328433
MKFHRVNNIVVRISPDDRNDGNGSTNPQTHMPEAARLLQQVLEANPPDPLDPLKRALPFQPRSYRDFMLFPAHYSGAAAGIAALSLEPPFLRTVVAWLSWLWTWLAGTVFPPFRPSGLYLAQPVFYQSNHLSVVSSGAPVVRPSYCRRYLDVELELGCVLGRELYNAVSPAEALAAVAGFCVLNDFSARDVQWAEMRSGLGPQLCKSFASSLSSDVVSADELLPLLPVESSCAAAATATTGDGAGAWIGKKTLTGRVVVNDKVVSECAVGREDWQFTLGEALAHASRGTRLYPGEFFGTGTLPGGAGIEHMAFEVQVGDTVRLEIDGVGSVTNTIIGEEEK